MKKFLMLLATMIITLTMCTIAYADQEQLLIAPMVISTNDNSIKVMQDGEYIDFTDSEGRIVEPQIINDRTMVPFRKIFNSLGVVDENITWISETRTVIAKKDNVEIELQIDNAVAKKTVSGETKSITLDSAPVIVDNRTLVPVRFIAESMEKLVGWDALNRTVIIIDMAKVQEKIENAMPKYVELINLQTEVINTMDATVTIKGEILYKDADNKSNNSTVAFTAKLNLKKSEDSIYADVVVNLSGKGELYNAIKESELTQIDLKLIFNGNKLYINSSLLDGEWEVIEDESISEIMNLINTVNSTEVSSNLIQLSEEDLSIYTYAQIETTINLLEKIVGDKNISITGTSTKKYEIKIDLLEVLNSLNEYGLDLSELETIKKLQVNGGGTIENGVAKTSTAALNFEIQEGSENITINIDATSKINNYNKTVNIEVPSIN